MPSIRISPGPSAHHAFRLGMIAAAIGAVAGIGFLYWFGAFDLFVAGGLLLILFPVYLLIVASFLSVWLGFGKDATDLRPVYREKEQS
ncbi:MAG: hypothetical protein SVG88_12800 [Halobacteriales archaeon]|nr:hypothetical protein [Halobacteriales archaeon]